MHLLLDTHLLIWAMGSPQRLPRGLTDMLKDSAHNLLCSVASLWDLVIKQAHNCAAFNVQPKGLCRALLEEGWHELTVQSSHVLALGGRPPLHQNPFDRLLLAEANAEAVHLIKADQPLAQYTGPIRWFAASPSPSTP
jgi:PIN domain nuclease of toxin-antitoxin system